MTSAPPIVFDRRTVRLRRDRAAAGFDAHAFLAERAAAELSERLSAVNRTFARALVLGAQTGIMSRALAGRAELVVSADLSPGMVAHAPAPRVAADEEYLPFAGGSLDLVVAALSLHFANDVPGVFVQIRRALKPDGLFLAAVLGGRTLHELRRALAEAESELEGGVSPRVAPFADVQEIGALLQRAGFALPVVDQDAVTVRYPGALALLRDLRGMGETNALAGRRTGLMRRATLARALDLYAQAHAGPDGRVPATFELIYVSGWAPHESQQKPLRPGSGAVSLGDVFGGAATPRP